MDDYFVVTISFISSEVDAITLVISLASFPSNNWDV